MALRWFLALSVLWTASASPAAPPAQRVIVLGFDGMDPVLAQAWMADGTLPNFKRLAERGGFQPLATTNPAQSPVAWSSFATGLNPGDHGVFDFLKRDLDTYEPQYEVASQESGSGHAVVNGRSGTPFWTTNERLGGQSSVLRVPVTYPPDGIHRMLSGMGVPDLLGSQGSFTFYTADPQDERAAQGGRIVNIEVVGDAIATTLEGPAHPLHGAGNDLAVPLTMRQSADAEESVHLDLDGHSLTLAPRQWSDWVPVSFRFLGLGSVRGMVRFYLLQGFPTPKLYVSPIQLDPRHPAQQISAPADYAGDLAQHIGLYHTAGMPEETWSLNEERLDDRAFLAMAKTVLAETEAMLFDTLRRNDSDLVVAVFTPTDRVSHMFWRGLDPAHARHRDTDGEARGAIKWVYREADHIVGRALQKMQSTDRLIVLSDHGFAPFHRAVHLNRWLATAGLLVTQVGQGGDAAQGDIDWARTRAYAVGLNGIYINRRGRERHGSVATLEAEVLKRNIAHALAQLRDPDNGKPIVLEVYDAAEIYRGSRAVEAPDLIVGYSRGYRASWQTALGLTPAALVEDNISKWSGDHCIDPSLVPGVLFTSFALAGSVPSITDIPSLIQSARQRRAPQLDAQAAPSHLSNRSLDFAKLAGIAALGALVSTWLFKRSINLRALTDAKRASLDARRGLLSYMGPVAGLWPRMAASYRAAAHELRITARPALLAAIPLLLVIVLLPDSYELALPRPGDELQVEVIPTRAHRDPIVHWVGGHAVRNGRQWRVTWPAERQVVRLMDHDGTTLVALPMAKPLHEIRQRSPWSLPLREGRALPDAGDIQAIRFDFPTREILSVGPQWMRHATFSLFAMIALWSALFHFGWRK